jgi:alpha-glucosidase
MLIRGARTIGREAIVQGAIHVLRTPWTEAKYAGSDRSLRATLRRLQQPNPSRAVTSSLGTLCSVTPDGCDLTLAFDHGALTLTALAPDAIRLRYRRHDTPSPPFPYAPSRDDGASFTVVETPDSVDVHTEQMICSVARADGRVTFMGNDRRVIAEQVAPVSWTNSGRATCRLALPPDAHLYGLGQRATALDRRGSSFDNWNTDPRSYDTGDDPLDLCIPFILALHSQGQQAYGLLIENTTRSRVDAGETDPDVLSIAIDETTLSAVFFYGPALATILERYTELTGRHDLFPQWILGYQQCRWSYYPEERVRRLARDFRETYQVPCDAIHLDIHYMDGYRCFTWDRERFPEPGALIDDLHDQGFKVITIIDPGIKSDQTYAVFRSGLRENAFCRYPDGKLFVGPVWPGNCAFPDFTDPRVRRWWGDLHRGLLDDGIDGFWNDMNEPALFGSNDATIPLPVRHEMEGHGSDHARAHNVYGMEMVRATVEGLARLRPDRRPFVLTRSGWTGVQRYAGNWTGDNLSTWESLRLTVPMVLGLGLSGVAFTGADIGGFSGKATGELFTRWLQMGAFLPFFRAHTALGTPDQEPWSWGEPYLGINREIIRLRYRLLPYLYTALWQSTQTGIPMARPLFLAFQEDPATFILEDQFLCGDALLVAPVLEEGATKRPVYLPAGTWFDFWTDERYVGPGHIEAKAPLERVPLFVRAGSVVPMGPAVDYVGQPTDEPLTLHVYAGEGDSWLYEDDGEGLAYRNGAYRLTRFTVTTTEDGVSLERRVEGLPEPGAERFNIVIHEGTVRLSE